MRHSTCVGFHFGTFPFPVLLPCRPEGVSVSSVSAVGGICAISGLTGRIAVNRVGTQLDADRITGWKQTPIPAPPSARGVPTGHTRSPAREGPAPPSARDVPTGNTRGPAREGPAPPPARGVQRGTHARPGARRIRAALGARRPNGAHTRPGAGRPPSFFLNNLRSVNTERAEARGHGGGWGEDVVPIAQLISIPQMRGMRIQCVINSIS